MAGIYNGYILEFPQIRVDCFTPSPNTALPHPFDPSAPSSSKLTTHIAPAAQLFLLTHVHSDHLLGLSNDFTGKIVCSPDTKRMLLRLEAEKSRSHFADGTREVIRRKYAGLAAKKRDAGTKRERVVDMIEAVPLNHPKYYILGTNPDGSDIRVTITLLDANHCPGSTMFLITSPDKAVLHTGDTRCDKLFMQTLKRNPIIQEFIVPTSTYAPLEIKSEGEKSASTDKGKGKEKAGGRLACGRRVLDRIYLDTSAFVGTGDMPDKEDALQDLIQLMALYPPDTIFFLNVWCFGWEDVIKEVARYFDSPVHVDRYKHSIFSAVHSDPFLPACTTLDASATRFHACERQAKCDCCRAYTRDGERMWNHGKRIVHVTMAEVKSAAWEIERKEFRDKLNAAAAVPDGKGNWPTNILCPLARHSPLPELQNLVRLFRPQAISPNTLVPTLGGIDYLLLPTVLADCIQPGALDRMVLERDTFLSSKNRAMFHHLKALQKSPEDLEAVIASSMPGGSERDDFLPDPSGGPTAGSVGGSRRDHAADQMQRAGGIVMASVQMTGYGGRAQREVHVDMEGYDTDEEEGRDRKRRRRRGSSPESMGDDLDFGSRDGEAEVKAEMAVVRPEAKVGTVSRRPPTPSKAPASMALSRSPVKKESASPRKVKEETSTADGTAKPPTAAYKVPLIPPFRGPQLLPTPTSAPAPPPTTSVNLEARTSPVLRASAQPTSAVHHTTTHASHSASTSGRGKSISAAAGAMSTPLHPNSTVKAPKISPSRSGTSSSHLSSSVKRERPAAEASRPTSSAKAPPTNPTSAPLTTSSHPQPQLTPSTKSNQQVSTSVAQAAHSTPVVKAEPGVSAMASTGKRLGFMNLARLKALGQLREDERMSGSQH